jgi:GMP synthase (glutamine-hydrolysing)
MGKTIAKPFLVIQHVESEDPGVFADCLERRGAKIRLVRIYRSESVPVESRDFSGVLIMGGPINVEKSGRYSFLNQETQLIRNCHIRAVPVLGICLGAQLIAASFGASVYSGQAKEIGWYKVALTPEGRKDILFEGFPETFTVFQWHGQTFDLPESAVRLARSPGYPNQALRIGENIWGLQFHLETTADHVRNWLKENVSELAGQPDIDPKVVLDGIAEYQNQCSKMAVRLFERFYALTLGTPAKH